MAYLNIQDAYDHFKGRILEGIKSHFPLKTASRTIELHSLNVKDQDADPYDLRSQQHAHMLGKTWGAPIFADLSLKDSEGNTINRQTIKIADLPRVTPRHSHIVDGKEYQVLNQWQLKPGVYVKRTQSGELEAKFNVIGRRSFNINFNPDTKEFNMIRGTSKKIPVYPILKAMGVDDDTLEHQWGKEILSANKKPKADSLLKIFKIDRGRDPKSKEEVEQHLQNTFAESKIRPEVSAITLGKPYNTVTGDALRAATTRLVAVQKGAPEDDRDSLLFKELRTTGDFAHDKLTDSRVAQDIRRKVVKQFFKAKSIRDIIRYNLFNDPIREIFTKNPGLAEHPDQINPVEMIANSQATTIMGSGGIQSQQMVDAMVASKLINKSHMGYLDTVRTPESNKSGVTLRLPMGIKKLDKDPAIQLYNIKTGKTELVKPDKFNSSIVVLPDQVTWKNGKPIPIADKVKASGKENLPIRTTLKEANYIFHHPSQLFSLTTNLIPFLGNNSGNRATYATHHIEQAISLEGRDVPLVQVGTGRNEKGMQTFEELIGSRASHASPIEGIVSKIKDDAIFIKGQDGKTKEVQIYNNFPLNDPKSFMHSTSIVKVGDKVKNGQTIADTNFSRNGILALGANLFTAYIPYKGLNFEDGVVVSKSAANKLTSVHMHKPDKVLEKDTITDPKKFKIQHPEAFSAEQYKKLDDEGIVQVGQEVKPGDPLVLAMRPFQAKDRVSLSAIGRALSGQHTDVSLRWGSDYAGKVVGVRQGRGEITVHVKTHEPLQIGDKISGRHGNKGIATAILDDDKMPRLKDGRHTEVLMNATSVPGRMNIGQILETAAGKIAQKTGKPYIVDNFANVDQLAKVKQELKSHGLTDQEELTDPITGKSLGKALVGPQHILKIVHTIDKKNTVRSGLALPGGDEDPEAYDSNLIPARGGKTGGQRADHLFLYSMLAHGAKCFLGSTEITVKGNKKRNQISSIVRERKEVEVLSYNSKTNTLEWKPVIAWQARVASPNELVEVRYSAFVKSGRKLGYATKCTSGHEFYTEFGKIEAGNLKPGDSILLPGTKLHPIHRQLIIGSTLGDGSLSRSETFNSGFRCGHCAKQEEYLRLKHEILKPITRSDVQRIAKRGGRFSKEPQYRLWTLSHGEISQLRKEFYPNGKKIVPDKLLNELNEIGLAFWFLDDGTTHIISNKYRNVNLCTDGFLKKDVKKLSRWLLSRWGIHSRIFIVRRSKDIKYKEYLRINIFNKSADRFLNLIAPYVPECLHYKLHLELGGIPKELVGSKLSELIGHDIIKSLEPTLVNSIRPYVPKSYEDYLVYNIEVKDNHNYFANGVLVGNSNIRELQTIKSEGPNPNIQKTGGSDPHHEIWMAIQNGEPLPTPKPTFAYRKFESMLKATGINVIKKGHSLQLTPLTDKQILDMSSGEIKKPGEVVYPTLDKFGDFKPKPGGLFDEKVTGGHGGTKFSYISLAEPLPNPVFEGAISKLLGLTQNEYLDIVQGKKAIDKNGRTVELDTVGSATGGPGIIRLLNEINVKDELAKTEKELSNTSISPSAAHRSNTPKIDLLVKKTKYLRMLNENKLTPTEAYTLKHLPVIPPVMRPPSTLPNGNVKWGDLNELYSDFGQINTEMKDPEIMPHLNDEGKKELRETYYDGVRALMGIGIPYADQAHKGIMHQIAGGTSPKKGYFQNVLMGRRQDMSMRSTIVPEPALGLDEVGLPKEKALSLFKAFVVKKLVDMGAAKHTLDARNLVVAKDPVIWKALENVAQERPILLKRDPVLHRHGVQGFRVKLISGKAIQIHPLVTNGFSADFDGDTMSVYVPISDEAVKEAVNMMPSNNLFNEASGKVVYSPTLESALGLYKLTRVTGDSGKKFSSAVDAINNVNSGKLNINETANIGGIHTTAGRVLVTQALPEQMHDEMLKDHDKVLDKKGIARLFDKIAREFKGDYGTIANKLKDLGNGASYGLIPIFHGKKGPEAIRLAEKPDELKYVSVPTHSLSLDDFTPDKKTRDLYLDQAKRQTDAINKNSNLTSAEKERRVIESYIQASSKMEKEHYKKIEKNPNNLALMLKAGVKPADFQYKQLALSPVLMSDALGNPIPEPITKSYSEGLDIGEYWTQMQGARRGNIQKVQEVKEPGTFSKRMIQTTMNLVVNGDDCGTKRGISMHVGDKDVYDRRLATDFDAKGIHFSAGTILNPDVVSTIRSADKNAILQIRSPLRCEHGMGICKKCAGLRADGREYELGTNAGILASQAMGERSTQLAMRSFHTGGLVQTTGGQRAVDDFDRVEQLTFLPESVPNEATVAMKSGKIEKIDKEPTGIRAWIGGIGHHIGKDKYGRSLHEDLPDASKSIGYRLWEPPKIGTMVEAGQSLSDPNRTVVNPRDLYKATNNMEKVQNFLVNELHDIYGNDVRRQHIEMAVKAMSNLTKVLDPGDADGILRGEFQPASQIRALNKELIKAGKRPVEHAPVMKGIDQMPLAIQEDWLAKMQHIELRKSLLESVAIGARSDLHGLHPVPSIAYGAEMGLTSAHSKKPGLEHLKNVPSYSY